MKCADFSDLDVIVLTYNRAKNLAVMLESLYNQTAKGFHIIVLNNASTDDTISVVEKFKEDYPNRDITLVTNSKNIGNVGNFKKSQQIAKNAYVAVFHDDDAIHPEYIETAMNLLTEHEDAVLCSGGVHPYYSLNSSNWDFLRKDYYMYPKEIGAYAQLHIARHMFQVAIYKTSIYKEIEIEAYKYGKLWDIIFLYNVSAKGSSIYILGECGRVGVSPEQDSCRLESGPYPDEIYQLVRRINEMTLNEVYAKPALWNFAYFLYQWSKLERFETWYEFCERLKETVFTDAELKSFCWKANMDKLNVKMAEHTSAMCVADGIYHAAKENIRSGLSF